MNYLILGAGKCAIESLKALIRRKKDVSICLNEDEKEKVKDYKKYLKKIYYFSDFYNIDFSKYDYIIRSPGISALNPHIKYLHDNNIKLINEIELTYHLTNKKGYYIGITGSNGKSTVVSLLYECIKNQTNNVILGGNIGTPLITYLDNINNYSIIIVEMSSYALEDMHDLKFDIAVILNLSENHLDSVPSLEYYYKSKLNIINNQGKDDYLLISDNDQNTKKYLNEKGNTKIVYYNQTELEISDMKLKGDHNISNAKAVLTILNILGFDIDYNVIQNFIPLEYHLQELLLVRNYLVVNDSKSTTVESLKSAIKTYENRNIILIFGGKNKGGNFSFLNKLNLKRKICFGKLASEIDNVSVHSKHNNLEKAVKDALDNVNDNDVILFSCGCSSFDLFNNYRERGKKFNELIEHSNFYK